MKLYHGTNNNAYEVSQRPMPNKAINGLAFYVTDDINVAKQYGRNVVCWEVEERDVNKNGLRKFAIDQSYVDGLSSYEDCVKGGFEYRLSKAECDEMVIESLSIEVL